FLKFTKSPYIYSQDFTTPENNKSPIIQYMQKQNMIVKSGEILTIKNYSSFLFFFFVFTFFAPIKKIIITPLLHLKNSIKEYLDRWKK
ncbi:MAG: hypothetical protein ACYDBX_04610, partial [Patescibacteria group bacterium]